MRFPNQRLYLPYGVNEVLKYFLFAFVVVYNAQLLVHDWLHACVRVYINFIICSIHLSAQHLPI